MRRFVRSQLLWTSDAVTWPSVAVNAVLEWRNNNTVVDTGQTSFNTVPMEPASLLGPLVLTTPECYVDLVFVGKWNATDANTSAALCFLRPIATGRPRCGIRDDDPVFGHPVGDKGATLEDVEERRAFQQSGLLVRGPGASTLYMGSQDSEGANLLNAWPYTGNAHVAEESWFLLFPVGRKTGHVMTAAGATEGSMEVSGYDKIWFNILFQNAASMTGAAMAQTSQRWYALISEEIRHK